MMGAAMEPIENAGSMHEARPGVWRMLFSIGGILQVGSKTC